MMKPHPQPQARVRGEQWKLSIKFKKNLRDSLRLRVLVAKTFRPWTFANFAWNKFVNLWQILTKRSYGTKNKKSTFRAKDEMFLWNIETPKITRRIIREFDLTPNPSPEWEGSNKNYVLKIKTALVPSRLCGKKNCVIAPLRALREINSWIRG